jgi:uncharacterized membrane-anchored protein
MAGVISSMNAKSVSGGAQKQQEPTRAGGARWKKPRKLPRRACQSGADSAACRSPPWGCADHHNQGKGMNLPITAAVLACGLLAGPALAQDGDAAAEAKARALISSLHYQQGEIALADAGAHLHVQPGFKYLGHDDTRKVLEELWGNPPDDDVLGLLVPDNAPLGSDHGWAVLVTYSDEGYVSDADASKIDYKQMLSDMQKETHEGNEERKKAGYGNLELVGWAQPPRYDAASKKLYWAKELAFEGNPQHDLNYDIRVLGREGFLSLNAIAGMGELPLVQEGMTHVLPMAEFDNGHRYADYKPGSDKLAAYGLAALIGGGLAAKAGLFAKLGVLLLAGKKFVVLAFVAIAAFFKKMFGGGKKDGGTVQ